MIIYPTVGRIYTFIQTFKVIICIYFCERKIYLPTPIHGISWTEGFRGVHFLIVQAYVVDTMTFWCDVLAPMNLMSAISL